MVWPMGDVAEHDGDRPASLTPVAGDRAAPPTVAGLSEPDAVLWLQRAAGNAATTRLLAARRGTQRGSTGVERGGQPLAPSTRAALERSFGRDLSDVRLHDGPDAGRAARAAGAIAYAHGADVVLDRSALPAAPQAEQFVVAHEVAHVIQQRGTAASAAGRRPSRGSRAGEPAEREADAAAARALAGVSVGPLRQRAAAGVLSRFEVSERNRIASLSAVISTARDIATRSMVRTTLVTGIDWPTFVNKAGGFSAFDAVARWFDISSNSVASLPNRYLITGRCGMVDMRHFYQLMYVALVRGNARATQMGREHELNSEPTSRFAAEDTPSNALGALFGAGYADDNDSSPDVFADALQSYLQRCDPVDFSALPVAEQDQIVHFYGDRDAAGVPLNQNEAATPAVLSIATLAGHDRSFPFYVEPGDAKTITDTQSLTGDTEIRNWVAAHPDSDLRRIPSAERNRMASRLFDGWVSDDDINAVLTLRRTAPNDSDRNAIDSVIRSRVDSLSDFGQRGRLRAVLP
jgi:hypothetical protein